MPDFVLRVRRDRLYGIIHLKACDEDPRLSWKAVGLHTYLTSRPDGWEFNRSDLVNRHKDGVGSVKKGLMELRDAGYLRMRRTANPETGRFKRYTWFVSEVPLMTEQEWGAFMDSPGVKNEPPGRGLAHRRPENEPHSKNTNPSKPKHLSLEIGSNGVLPKGWGVDEFSVFTYWRDQRAEVLGLDGKGPAMQPTDGRRGKIRARMKEGYTVDQLREAVDGILTNSLNIDKGFLDIDLICRDQGKVEQYRAWKINADRNQTDKGDETIAWAKAEKERILRGGE